MSLTDNYGSKSELDQQNMSLTDNYGSKSKLDHSLGIENNLNLKNQQFSFHVMLC